MTYQEQLLAYAESSGRYAEAVSGLLDSLAAVVAANERNLLLLEKRMDSLEKTLHERTDHLS